MLKLKVLLILEINLELLKNQLHQLLSKIPKNHILEDLKMMKIDQEVEEEVAVEEVVVSAVPEVAVVASEWEEEEEKTEKKLQLKLLLMKMLNDKISFNNNLMANCIFDMFYYK